VKARAVPRPAKAQDHGWCENTTAEPHGKAESLDGLVTPLRTWELERLSLGRCVHGSGSRAARLQAQIVGDVFSGESRSPSSSDCAISDEIFGQLQREQEVNYFGDFSGLCAAISGDCVPSVLIFETRLPNVRAKNARIIGVCWRASQNKTANTYTIEFSV
jgi:hypothetical protein